MAQSTDDLREELRSVLNEASRLGLVAVDVNAGNLHRRVGGYPGGDHRMPACCEAMYSAMGSEDAVVEKPKAGKGASVTVRYVLPRS